MKYGTYVYAFFLTSACTIFSSEHSKSPLEQKTALPLPSERKIELISSLDKKTALTRSVIQEIDIILNDKTIQPDEKLNNKNEYKNIEKQLFTIDYRLIPPSGNNMHITKKNLQTLKEILEKHPKSPTALQNQISIVQSNIPHSSASKTPQKINQNNNNTAQEPFKKRQPENLEPYKWNPYSWQWKETTTQMLNWFNPRQWQKWFNNFREGFNNYREYRSKLSTYKQTL